jgi:hypothetical protein
MIQTDHYSQHASLPHYHIFADHGAVRIEIDDFDPTRGHWHTSHTEPDWPSAWDWTRRHYRLVGGATC